MARYTNPVPQILDGNGVPIVGAKKFFFNPGTTVKKTIYSDSALTVTALNPQISDGNGRFSECIFLDGLYKEEQQDNSGTASGYDGVTLWTKDPIGDVVSGEFGLWVSDTIYNIPDKVVGSDDFSYESLTDSNQGNDPISSPSNWAKITFVKAGVLDGVTEVKDSNSLTSIIVTAISTAVNYLKFSNSVTGSGPTIEPDGTDTNIDLNINAKGAGTVNADITGNLTGNADTVTTNANLTGDVTSIGNAATISANSVDNTMLDLTTVAATTYITASADTVATGSTTAYTKEKEIRVPYSGTIDVYFELRSTTGGTDSAQGRIYVNGSPIGTERSTTSTAFQPYNETVSIAPGDLVQLYAKFTSGGAAEVQNFRLRESAPVTSYIVTLD